MLDDLLVYYNNNSLNTFTQGISNFHVSYSFLRWFNLIGHKTRELLAQSFIRKDTLDDSQIGPLKGTLHLVLCVERQTSVVYIMELPCPLVSGWLWPLRGHGRRREIRRLS